MKQVESIKPIVEEWVSVNKMCDNVRSIHEFLNSKIGETLTFSDYIFVIDSLSEVSCLVALLDDGEI